MASTSSARHILGLGFRALAGRASAMPKPKISTALPYSVIMPRGIRPSIPRAFSVRVTASLHINPQQVAGVHTAPEKAHDMFCYQCEQTRAGTGCTTVGVCGKGPETAALQDLLIHALKGVSHYVVRLQKLGLPVHDTDFFVLEALFSTLTNVNFDAAAMQQFVNKAIIILHQRKSQYEEECKQRGLKAEVPDASLTSLQPSTSVDTLVEGGRQVGLEQRRIGMDEDIFSLQELLVYGIKGMAAYSAHAVAVGQTDAEITKFVYTAMDYLSKPEKEQTMEKLLDLCMGCGAANYRAMEILNEGHISNFGKPEPTKLRTTPVKGKCILVSGHDLKDLHELLKQTEGTGVNVYTHGEMLPAHGYPELKKYKHLVGNYGGAWQLQKMEFPLFPGPILVTTNCILEPKPSYQDRIYSINAVGHSKVRHLEDRNFRPLIDQALAMEGFPEDTPEAITMTGFGHHAVLGAAEEVIQLVNEGKIKRFFLIGGCDGWEGERSYYKDLARGLPQDAVVLTLACGKYRFNKQFTEFGNIPGSQLPRLMDIGQCNDAYSAIRIASALADAFKTDVNSLPLSIVLSWFEQKAVAVLLTLLHLGIQNVRIGPKLPAFVTPNVLNVLVEKYKLTPIGDAEEDMATMLGYKPDPSQQRLSQPAAATLSA
eukprot:TRINITY_DN22909_c0_g1_i1.p1 TRINITY_DN22909_c0_g1~~TRINITY_DN22909_c0_g1_i1.p1  ORF type:complete len:654 (+),score=134.56 TRINITY_DN22909_c0_g1_i1:136-2097(+)